MSILNRWKRGSKAVIAQQIASQFAVESLEDRRLLSVAHPAVSSASFGGGRGHGRVENTITLGALPGGTTGTIATELDTLASTTLATTQTVYLGNSNGVETYSVRVTGTGSVSTYTVDVDGDPVSAPTHSTTTFSALSSTIAQEFDAIATGDGLTDPAMTATVYVSTPTTGTGPVVYTVRLTNSKGRGGQEVSVDASGNPTGNETIAFSALSTALQGEITDLVPTGDTAPAATSNVRVETVDGVTLYSVTVTGTGSRTTLTVNEAGELTSLPSSTSTTYSALSSAVQSELLSLATADGYTGTSIAGTTAVTQYTEANGNIIYAVSVPVSKTSSSGNTFTINITVASDSNGNPTVPPTGGGFGGGGCGGGGGGLFGGGISSIFGGDGRRR